MRLTIHETWAYVRRWRQKIGGVAQAASETAKLGSVVGLPVGTAFLVIYLETVSAPFPLSASALPTLLLVLTLTCGLVVVVLTSTMLWAIEPIAPFQTRTLRNATPNLRMHVERPEWIGLALKEYGLVYLPFLLLWTCTLVGAVIKWQPSALMWLWILLGCLGAGFAGDLVFFSLRTQPAKAGEADRHFHKALLFSAQACGQSIATLILLFPYLAIMESLGHLTDPRGIFLLIIILVVHFFANVGRIGRVKSGILSVGMLLFFMVATGGFSLFGAVSLRMLGIGGGIPCDIVLRTFEPSSGAPVVSVERGCLLIATGSEIALHPTKDAGKGGCTLAQIVGHRDNVTSRWGVDIYPQSAIIKMSILTQLVAQAGS